ncbi:Crp/Fnr family transcriptional regulator [Bacillus sp. BHET2]|uniref:Crp/Fnr family transcriptional regulator n=1 Tax=Bacillus sp. BHET2 TaxID=2583818 RepID=UPI00110E8844|nr:Crp/Fnr family transcriptional regulator [Bacillus sp. BHET2]TMU85869.1 Crp/Fnr family transcriptional regulator [Bacillus sp. BHET2]
MKDVLIQYMKRFTDISEEELKKLTMDVPVATFKKGAILLRQGEVPDKCYFVLKGCIRQYSVDNDGNENTFNFFTEEQSVTIFNAHELDKASKYSLCCLEECTLVVGDLATEQKSYDMHPVLETMTRKMMEADVGAMRDEFASFMSSSPEKRYEQLLERRSQLIERVPQYQLASYLGITPESLSRIKKRALSNLRIVD